MVLAFGTMLESMPPQQLPFFAEDGTPLLPMFDETPGAEGGFVPEGGEVPENMEGMLFGQWAGYAYHSERFHPSMFVEALTYRSLDPQVRAAYDAPFPSREYMAGPRAFPRLLNDLAGRTAGPKAALTGYQGPSSRSSAATTQGSSARPTTSSG